MSLLLTDVQKSLRRSVLAKSRALCDQFVSQQSDIGRAAWRGALGSAAQQKIFCALCLLLSCVPFERGAQNERLVGSDGVESSSALHRLLAESTKQEIALRDGRNDIVVDPALQQKTNKITHVAWLQCCNRLLVWICCIVLHQKGRVSSRVLTGERLQSTKI